MVALSLSTADYLAHEIHESVHGLGTNERTLIEILCTLTNDEIRQLNESYLRRDLKSIEKSMIFV